MEIRNTEHAGRGQSKSKRPNPGFCCFFARKSNPDLPPTGELLTHPPLPVLFIFCSSPPLLLFCSPLVSSSCLLSFYIILCIIPSSPSLSAKLRELLFTINTTVLPRASTPELVLLPSDRTGPALPISLPVDFSSLVDSLN